MLQDIEYLLHNIIVDCALTYTARYYLDKFSNIHIKSTLELQ